MSLNSIEKYFHNEKLRTWSSRIKVNDVSAFQLVKKLWVWKERKEIKLFMYLLTKFQASVNFVNILAGYCTKHNNNRDEMKLLQGGMFVIFAIVSGECRNSCYVDSWINQFTTTKLSLAYGQKSQFSHNTFGNSANFIKRWKLLCKYLRKSFRTRKFSLEAKFVSVFDVAGK